MARMRQQFTRTAKAQSHYQYKNWTYDNEGNRSGAYAVRPLRPEHADLISTALYNPVKKTQTVYTIAWDLDAHRAAPTWKDSEGRLDWGVIGNHLFENHSILQDYTVAAIRSTGGKGIALLLAITPLEITDSTKTGQQTARAVQMQFFNLLKHYKMGVDEGALGLVRDFPNWRNPAKVIDGNLSVFSTIQAENNRPAVLSELVRYFNTVPMCSSYQHKKEAIDTYLYPDLRAESKLALLYKHLHELYFDEDMTEVVMTTKELQLLTGLSHIFLGKMLQTGLSWLDVKDLGKREGWSLQLKFTRNLTDRAFELLNKTVGETVQVTPKITLDEELKRPEEVKDGERNEWITKLSLTLKHSGIEQDAATQILKEQIVRIEGNAYSRNCRNSKKILTNIYENKPEYFGCKMGQLDLSNVFSINRFKESETKFKKGTTSPRLFTEETNRDSDREVSWRQGGDGFRKGGDLTFAQRAFSPAEKTSVGF